MDKEGNVVDIVGDLERLEEQMGAYITDIDEQIQDVKEFEKIKDDIYDGFD